MEIVVYGQRDQTGEGRQNKWNKGCDGEAKGQQEEGWVVIGPLLFGGGDGEGSKCGWLVGRLTERVLWVDLV